MDRNNHRAITPKSNLSAHAQMMSRSQVDSSPIFPTPFKYEALPSSSSLLQTTYSSAFPVLREGEANTLQHSPTASPSPSTNSDGSVTLSNSPRLKLRPTPRQTDNTVSLPDAFDTSDMLSYPSSSSISGLKLKLRGIQAALKTSPPPSENLSTPSEPSSTFKRKVAKAFFSNDSETDSEIDIMPPSRKEAQPATKKPAARTSSRKAKKVKVSRMDSDYEVDATFDAGDEVSSPATPSDHKLILSSNVLKRSERMLDPNDPEHARLIAAAPKAGSEYYDSDADELPGKVKDTSKPHLFRNVKWGSVATDYSDASVFTTEPEFTQFVPGRFERLPNNTAYDQKHKLIIRLTDSQNRARIFTNPPPVDWNNQEAITALNKRTVQQIRRNTSVRFREVVEPYVQIERRWILAHLQEGKPMGGWKAFVEGFNKEFEGRVVQGATGERPKRSHSSLTKEVERFGSVYAKGEVPRTGAKGKVVKRRGTRTE